MKKFNKDINGLTGAETNPRDPRNPNSPLVHVSFDAEPLVGISPDHSINGTFRETCGTESTLLDPTPMNGFVWVNGPDDMRCYNESTVPVISTLARQFTVMDAY